MLAVDHCHRCTGLAFVSPRRHCLLSRRTCSKPSAANINLGQSHRHTICPVSASAQKQSASPITAPVTGPPLSRPASSNSSSADANVASSREGTNIGTILAGALLPFLQQRWALADTVQGEPTDYLITGIFVVVVLALAIVTVGVAYLSLNSFLDKRAEDEDKKKFEAAQRDRDLQALGINKPKRKRSPDEITRGGGKGFGS